jgi:hypothetical protein
MKTQGFLLLESASVMLYLPKELIPSSFLGLYEAKRVVLRVYGCLRFTESNSRMKHVLNVLLKACCPITQQKAKEAKPCCVWGEII